MTENKGQQLEVAYALHRNDTYREQLVSLLQNNTDEILVTREFLSVLYARLGNDSLLLGRMLPEAKYLKDTFNDPSWN